LAIKTEKNFFPSVTNKETEIDYKIIDNCIKILQARTVVSNSDPLFILIELP